MSPTHNLDLSLPISPSPSDDSTDTKAKFKQASRQFCRDPSDEDGWVPCLVPTIKLKVFRELFQIPRWRPTRPTHDGSHHEFAITEDFLEWLVKNNFPIKPSWCHPRADVSLATKQEETFYGPRYANRRAHEIFIHNAIVMIFSGRHGPGLEQYYLQHVNVEVAAGIKWGVLLRDILQFHPDDRRRGFQHCVLIALHSIRNLKEATGFDFMKRTEDEWLCWLKDLCFERALLPVVAPAVEMQLLSLVQAVFQSALMPPMSLMNIDIMLAAEANAKTLSKIFDSGIEPNFIPLGSYDENELKDLLVHCDLFKDTDMCEVAWRVERIRECVPVGFSTLRDTLPCLFQSIQPENVQVLQNEMLNLYSQVPLAWSPENDLLVFLCSCAFLNMDDVSLCKWATSDQGLAFSRQVLKGLDAEDTIYQIDAEETIYQTILRVLALHNFEKLRSWSASETTEPDGDCYLYDFQNMVKGATFNNRRGVFHHMACSLRRTIGTERFPGFSRLFASIGEDDPPRPCNGLSDQYWAAKLRRAMDREDAWTMILGRELPNVVPTKDAGQYGQDQVDDDFSVFV